MTNLEYYREIIKGKTKEQISQVVSMVFNRPAKWDNDEYKWLKSIEDNQYHQSFRYCPQNVYISLQNLKALVQFQWFSKEYDGKWCVKKGKHAKRYVNSIFVIQYGELPHTIKVCGFYGWLFINPNWIFEGAER